MSLIYYDTVPNLLLTQRTQEDIDEDEELLQRVMGSVEEDDLSRSSREPQDQEARKGGEGEGRDLKKEAYDLEELDALKELADLEALKGEGSREAGRDEAAAGDNSRRTPLVAGLVSHSVEV